MDIISQLRKVDDGIMSQVSYVFISSVVSKTWKTFLQRMYNLKHNIDIFPLVSLVRPSPH